MTRRAAGPLLLAVTLVASGCATSTGAPRAESDPDSAATVAAALQWLALVDAGLFEASLDSAAPLLRSMAGSAEGWRRFVEQARGRYPVSSQRALILREPAYAPEGAPPGEYVRLTFESPMPSPTRESVVLVRTASGWRVAMYGLLGR